jgi:hypothetical protein
MSPVGLGCVETTLREVSKRNGFGRVALRSLFSGLARLRLGPHRGHERPNLKLAIARMTPIISRFSAAETVEHPFGTIKARMGATHFLMKTLPRVASEIDPVTRVTYVAAVIGDLEHFVGEVLNLKCPRESVPAAKFLIASEPAAYCGFRRHPGVRTDGPKTFTVEEPKADRHSNLGIITGQTAALGRVVDVHRGYQGS